MSMRILVFFAWRIGVPFWCDTPDSFFGMGGDETRIRCTNTMGQINSFVQQQVRITESQDKGCAKVWHACMLDGRLTKVRLLGTRYVRL